MNENHSQVARPSSSLKSSPDIGELTESLSRAQSEFPVIPKDSIVDVYSKPPEKKFLYSYAYADLTTIIAATRPAMTKHGISFTQGFTKDSDLGVGLETILMKGPQWLRTGFIPCRPPNPDDMKAVAGAATYAKRISLSAALGVSADEDMDAPQEKDNSVTKVDPKKKIDKTPQNKKAEAVNPDAADAITLAAKAGKPVNHAPKAESPFKLSDVQIDDLYNIGYQNNWTQEGIEIFCVAKVNRRPENLSQSQYTSFCNLLGSSPFDADQNDEIELMSMQLTPKQLEILNARPS